MNVTKGTRLMVFTAQKPNGVGGKIVSVTRTHAKVRTGKRLRNVPLTNSPTFYWNATQNELKLVEYSLLD